MIGTLRRELLYRILIVNERHLRRVLTVYLHHDDRPPARSVGGKITDQFVTIFDANHIVDLDRRALGVVAVSLHAINAKSSISSDIRRS